MTTSATLLALLNCKADLNYYTSQEIYWTNLYDSNASRLSKQEKYQTSYDNYYDKALENEKEGFEIDAAGNTIDGNATEAQATRYAAWKEPNYDEDLYEELSDLDIEYDTMKTMYDTMMEEKQAEYDALKEKVGTEAQDTHLLGS